VSEAKRFLVLGSNSFSGASFVDFVLQRGDDVVGISRSPEPHRAFLPYRWSDRGRKFRFFQLDLNRDLDAIADLIGVERPAYVVNFAAQSMVAESWDKPDHWFTTNVVSTVRLHEKLRRCAFLKKYVHVTTPEVYGSVQGFVREDAPFNPSTPYAVSRAAADMSLRTYHAAYGFPVVFTRAANVYGPGQQLYRIVPRAILSVKLGKKLPLHGGGSSERSFIHASDLSEATYRVALDGESGETFHISTERVVTIRALVEMICRKLGAIFTDCVEIVGDRLGKDAAYRLDSGKIRRDLGWKDQISLEEGIDETIQWVDQFFNDLRNQPMQYVHKP
jgi:dTDP-glucose 4,6-dehydratase